MGFSAVLPIWNAGGVLSPVHTEKKLEYILSHYIFLISKDKTFLHIFSLI